MPLPALTSLGIIALIRRTSAELTSGRKHKTGLENRENGEPVCTLKHRTRYDSVKAFVLGVYKRLDWKLLSLKEQRAFL